MSSLSSSSVPEIILFATGTDTMLSLSLLPQRDNLIVVGADTSSWLLVPALVQLFNRLCCRPRHMALVLLVTGPGILYSLSSSEAHPPLCHGGSAVTPTPGPLPTLSGSAVAYASRCDSFA
eukprot:CAMPEP_0172553736 /NCGR_PEP_ID=MMETSP1067-20121228/51513_1 /TAXON_ID=265564 ORGANISM="Thalassiosira punctigera, Strain Tpunct2005C2" /NCGR_SAMPLE_ID=MMETSP1067 /ASSEMBLY_ACC=CAM_ASM_000444 /LENGTH=120 /DNA_ID=CAMNT_0013341959 /DNA_START=187 /DNA_END=546 /DNA_ORIENTATION=-